jgi:hypothetical protein
MSCTASSNADLGCTLAACSPSQVLAACLGQPCMLGCSCNHYIRMQCSYFERAIRMAFSARAMRFVTISPGMRKLAGALFQTVVPILTVLGFCTQPRPSYYLSVPLCGCSDASTMGTRPLLGWKRRLLDRLVHLCSVCTGVVVAIMFAVVALRFMGGQFYSCNDPGVRYSGHTACVRCHAGTHARSSTTCDNEVVAHRNTTADHSLR